MFGKRRGSGTHRMGGVALALALPALSLVATACAPVVGGGVLAAVVAIGALTSHCYDYADVTVYDPGGHRTCDATVSATSGRDDFELKSCYYAPLTDGHWIIRAKLPGFPDAVSAVDVEHANDCTRHVQSMQLTINAPGSPSSTPTPVVQDPSVQRLPPPPAPPPVGPVSTAPAPALPNVAPPPSSSAGSAPSAPPVSSTTPPSVGVFPDQATRPSPPK
jgi:hypothetical protein